MNVWSGAIALDGESQLSGINLIDRSCNGQSLIHRGSSIRYRSFVNPALIPLCARSGPNLELHTTDAQTSQWLKTKILSFIWLDDEEIETLHTLQCPVGILATVESDNESKKQSCAPVSDILIYGVLSRARATIERPPTPPESSSWNSQNQDDPQTGLSSRQELRFYAAPLSATLLEKAKSQIPPLRSDSSSGLENLSGTTDEDDSFAQFLPDVRSPSPKRKRVAALFDVAAQHHRRVRQGGGGAVSQLMANSHSHPQSQSQSFQQSNPPKIKKEVDELTYIPPVPTAAAAVERINSQQRARSMSIGTNNAIHNKQPPDRRITIEPSRPSSSRGLARAPSVKRQMPHPFLDSFESRAASPFLAPPDIETNPSSSPKDAESIIAENKDLIVRTILTCMRLWGFNRSKPSRLVNLVDDENSLLTTNENTNVSPGADEDAFKAMYHATYRASTFALRKYLKENDGLAKPPHDLPPLLAKERATTVVDDVLRLFCEEN